MTDIAQVVADHFGGQVCTPANMREGQWLIEIADSIDIDDDCDSQRFWGAANCAEFAGADRLVVDATVSAV